MKKFWLVMLSLGFVLAFSTQVLAVDVKFSGEFYAAGMYQDKIDLIKTGSNDHDPAPNISTAFYYQRLRVRTDFVVSPGLTLVTRFDAMERAWGAPRSSAGGGSSMYINDSAETEAENENIAFDWAYIQYASPIGTFTVGYQNDGAWGTVFGDSSVPQGKIGWSLQKGDWTVMAEIVKLYEGSKTAKTTSTPYLVDNDIDKYMAGVTYSWKGGQAGIAGAFYRYAYEKQHDWYFNNPALATIFVLMPYAKAKIGPVTIQTELNYGFGEAKMEDGLTGQDVKLRHLAFFLDAVADFNMFYAGGTFAYISGDDPDTADSIEGSMPFSYGGLNGGMDWNPCLILWNFERTKWAGRLTSGDDTGNSSPMSNVWFLQGRAGVRPVAKLDIMASVTYAVADQKYDVYGDERTANKNYGWEIDITGTYKITNNLSYMLGFGYLFTGDYFKGIYSADTNAVRDNYMVINKLTLTF